MIDEKAREIAANICRGAKSAYHKIKVSIDYLLTEYLDNVRWYEFVAWSSGAHIICNLMIAGNPTINHTAARTAMVLFTLLVFLRNPKMARWEDNPTVTECVADSATETE